MTSNSGEDTACLRISLNAKDLVENVIITVECFLPIKEGADDGAGGIIDSKMKDGLAFPEPEMKRAVHSDFFRPQERSGDGQPSQLRFQRWKGYPSAI